MCMVLGDFVCIDLLLPFVLRYCLSVFIFIFYNLKFLFLNNYFLL